MISLSEYVGRMVEGQQEIYYINSPSRAAAESGPYVEAFRKRDKTKIQPNVDFYSAPVYHMMGIPGDLMTPIFAMARVSGWCAHIIEEQFAGAAPKPMLYRPESEYVGDYCGPDVCEYTPMDER